MELKEITIGTTTIQYQVQVKNIKRCYLKVIAGKVLVTTSKYFSAQDIEKLIIQNKDKILQALDGYVSKYQYHDGGYVYIFGKKYTIVVRDVKKKKCAIHGNDIYVYDKNIQPIIEKYIKEVLFLYIDKQIDILLVNDFVVEKPSIELKKTKGRWGACFSKQKKVSFNLVLGHVEQYLIDYVILHEMCHFLQANHSKQFYQELSMRMKDYKQREKRLKEIGI